MKKGLFKEIIIMLLLLLAIILILGVILYDYMPTNKIIPEKVSYTTSAEIKNEIQPGTTASEELLPITFKIDATDLNNYKRIQEYVPGKKNPFESVDINEQTSDTESGSEGSTSTSSSSSNSSSSSASASSSSSNGYLPDKGTK